MAFRLKESGRESWYYEANYNTDQFLPGKLFPFGFPIIPDSNGKTYIFEIESLRGTVGSGIFIDQNPPVFTAVSFLNRGEILNSIPKILDFATRKVVNVVADKENLTTAVIYFSPFIFYLIYLLLSGVSFQILSGLTLVVIITEIYYLPNSSNFLYLSTLFLWGLTVYRHHFETRITATVTIILLSISGLYLLFNEVIFAEKFSIWAYLFLCASVIQQIYELNSGFVNKYSLDKVIKNILIVKFDKTKPSSHFLKNVTPPLLWLICTRPLFQSYARINQSITLFKDFYPNLNTIPNLSNYVLLITLIVFVAIVILILKRATFRYNPALFLAFALLFKITIFSVSDHFTVFQHTPKILSISPSTTSEAWVDITISGKNFQNMPFVGKVFIDGVEQGEYILLWSNEKIVFRTNPTFTKSGKICIQTLSKGNSNCLRFEYNFGKKIN